jgi:flavodoxin
MYLSIEREQTMKSLLIYYSRTGKTKFVAETIAAELGSDIEEVVDLKNRDYSNSNNAN